MITIEREKGCAFILKKGQRLLVMDPEGSQVSDLFCFNAHDAKEMLSSGRSIDYADKIYLSVNDILYSNRSEPMLRISEDTCGIHDFLMTPCSLKMFQIVAQSNDWHPSCHENLSESFKEFQISPDSISTTFNIFMNVKIDPRGRIKIQDPVSKPGDYIIFESLMDLIVGLTACSHEETNAGRCKPIQYKILEPV